MSVLAPVICEKCEKVFGRIAMAEFKEVIRQYKRLCDEMTSCGPDCPLYAQFGICTGQDFLKNQSEKFETIVMEWAKKHPEKTYLETLTERLPGLNTDLIPKRTCPGWFVPGWPKSQDGFCVVQTSTCRECWERTAEKE